MNNRSAVWQASIISNQMSSICSFDRRNSVNIIGSDDINLSAVMVSRIGNYTDPTKTGWGVTMEQNSRIGLKTLSGSMIGEILTGIVGRVG